MKIFFFFFFLLNVGHVTASPIHGGFVLWQNKTEVQQHNLVDWTSRSRKASMFIFNSFLCIQSFASIFPFSPFFHLDVCALPLIICVTNPSILFSPNSQLYCMHQHLVGDMLCFTLPIKHSCRMTHYLWGEKKLLYNYDALKLAVIELQQQAQHKPQWCCKSWDVNETSCHDLLGDKQ